MAKFSSLMLKGTSLGFRDLRSEEKTRRAACGSELGFFPLLVHITI